MDLKSVLKRYDTKSKNTSDLTPHYVSREANLKVLAKLEARNNERKAKSKYHYTSMLDQLKTRSTSAMLENPKPYAQQLDQSSANQKMELIRMAKITANEARSDMATYDQTREQFITNYSPKINEFRMLPQIQGIFQQFSDPNYSEKGYDKNYLGQGASDKYLESILRQRQSDLLTTQMEDLQRRQDTTTGAVQDLLHPISMTNTAIDELLVPTKSINRSVRDLQRDLLDAIGSTNSEVIDLKKLLKDRHEFKDRQLQLKDIELTDEDRRQSELRRQELIEQARRVVEESKSSGAEPVEMEDALKTLSNQADEVFRRTQQTR